MIFAARSIVNWFTTSGERCLTFGLNFFDRAVTAVGFSYTEQSFGGFLIQARALALKIRAFIPVQPEPVQGIKNFFELCLGRALTVGIINTQDERAALLLGIEVGKKCGTCAADM